MSQPTPEEVLQQQADNKFERNLKIVAGVISVLGVAATTVMTIMEAEKEVRKSMRRGKGRKRIAKRGSPKALKAPPKKKVGKLKPIINEKQLLDLEKQAKIVLGKAMELKKEVKNGHLSGS